MQYFASIHGAVARISQKEKSQAVFRAKNLKDFHPVTQTFYVTKSVASGIAVW